jgi:CelD/BcsL family acetyltransferase involved in cellulose biosynthesis
LVAGIGLARLAREWRRGDFVRIETIHPRELGEREHGLWRAHQASDAALSSPYLSPAWARIVGDARPDARVCVIGAGRGFLGVQRRSRFAAMGLGAPLADYQGLVSEPGLAVEPGALCRALKVGRIDLAGVPAGQSVLAGAVAGADGSWIADTSGGVEAYRAHLKKHRGKIVRQTDNRLAKLAEAHGPLEFAGGASERGHFDTLVAWKAAHLRRTGQPPIWTAPWVARVLNATWEARDPGLSGVLFSLSAGDRLAAASYALRSERGLHVWLIGHDERYDAFSPGVALARWLIEWAAGQGLAEVDFGVGDYQFKRHLSTGQRMLEWGSATRPSWSALVRKTQIGLRGRIEQLPQPKLAALPGRAMRRLDVMRGLASA